MSQISQLSKLDWSYLWSCLYHRQLPSHHNFPCSTATKLATCEHFSDKSPFHHFFLSWTDTKQMWWQCSQKSVVDIIFGHVGASVNSGRGGGVGGGGGRGRIIPMFPGSYVPHFLWNRGTLLTRPHTVWLPQHFFLCVFHDSMCLCAKFCANQPIGGAFMYKWQNNGWNSWQPQASITACPDAHGLRGPVHRCLQL